MDRGSKRVERTKEGVPVWDGDASTFQEYSEWALLWEQSIQYQKRYLCAPRLINELGGTARRLVTGKRPEWVSFNGGVQKLLDHLRDHLGLPQMPEAAEFLTRYFKQTRRRKGETINEYITRKTESYSRARQALDRVQKSLGQASQSNSWSGRGPGSSTRTTPSGMDPWQARGQDPWSRSQRDEGRTSESAPAGSTSAPAEGDDDVGDGLGEADDEQETQHSYGPRQWSWWDSNWNYDSWEYGWPTSYHGSEEQAWLLEAPELLPEYVQGWYLLYDSGLETNEKNMIIAALKGNFNLSNVAQELRNQWSDEDLRRRDQSSRSSGFWADGDGELSAGEDEGEAWMMDEQLSEEGQALVSQAQHEIMEAQAQIDQGRRTLRQARARQHQVRMSRRYYKTSYHLSQPDRQGRGNAPDTCLKCGGRHKTTDCLKKSPGANNVDQPEAAPFVCFSDMDGSSESAMTLESGITTRDAVMQGKAVIDGGATKTLGSVTALQYIMDLNKAKVGDTGINDLDLSDRPVFGFGNSSRDQCISTAKLSIQADQKPGNLKIHALDRGEGPVLFSIEALRSLGAVIDFAEDLVVFRSLCDDKIIKLERSNTGHQLLPLTNDWYERALKTQSPVPSLRSFVADC